MFNFCSRAKKPLISRVTIALACSLTGSAVAQGPQVPAPAPSEAALRYPQPVRVGDLTNRLVLEPSNHQGVLGRVDSVARDASGQLLLVMRYGGLLGFFTRKVAVPLNTATLLGQFVQVVDVPREQIAALPNFDAAAASVLADDEVVRMGLNRN